jgi:hypothetical protein
MSPAYIAQMKADVAGERSPVPYLLRCVNSTVGQLARGPD